MRLNTKSIMIAEQILKGSFFDMDLSDIEKLKILSYCMAVTSGKAYTKEQFETVSETKAGTKILNKGQQSYLFNGLKNKTLFSNKIGAPSQTSAEFKTKGWNLVEILQQERRIQSRI